MLVPMKEILDKALEGGYAVPAFMAWDETSFRSICEVAQEMNSPVITITGAHAWVDIAYYGRIMQDIAAKYSVPIATCLDHGGTYEEAITAIRSGYSSIMVDRSTLPLEENIAQVKELVKVAHAVGVSVEAELGHVGFGLVEDPADVYTVPSEAKRFVEETGVDCLAVAVGTAHGRYPKGFKPELRYDLIEEIEGEVGIPLVLHGGSGTGDENLAKAAKSAICKINIANDLVRSAYETAVNGDMSGNNIYGLFDVLYSGYKDCARHYIEVFGCANKA